MSIKKLFDNQEVKKSTSAKSNDSVGSEIEATEYVEAAVIDRERFLPAVDFSKPENFAKFGSAEQYYADSIKRIYVTYPYDGSKYEKLVWHNSSSYLDKYIFEHRYPRTTGYALFSPTGWTTQLSQSWGSNAAANGKATATLTFSDKPNEERVITLIDADGTSITFEVDNHNDGVATAGAVALDPAANSGAGIATELASEVNGEATLGITATNPSSGVVLLTMDTAGAAGNTAIVTNMNNVTGDTTAFTGGAAFQGGYGRPTTKEYIQVKGGPHAGPSGTRIGANIYDSKLNRASNLRLRFSSSLETGSVGAVTREAGGSTVEFWLKKAAFATGTTQKEVIFDLWNGEASSSSGYGRFTIELSGTNVDESPFRVTLQSGSKGFSNQVIGTTINSASVADDNWHHYAFSFIASGNNIISKFYVTGALNQELTISAGTTLGEVTGSLIANIGALRVAPSGANGVMQHINEGDGKLSASLDEFRYWKVKRTSKDIGRHWFSQVNGGTNEIDANVDLGVYYKFNEGIVEDSTTDSVVLDYAGRISNGAWTGYNSSSRATGSAINEASASTEYKDPIVRRENPLIQTFTAEMKNSGSIHDINNNASMYYSLPTWIIEEDRDDEHNQLYNLVQILSAYLDTLYLQIESLPQIKDTTYRYVATGSAKPLPFNNRLLESAGMTTPEIFVEAGILEQLSSRNENIEFDDDLHNIKNLIYQNIYNNLNYIYKSKGTEKSFRNLIRCFGVSDELIKLSLYADHITYEFRDNYRTTTTRKTYLDFNNTGSFGATVYQAKDTSNSNSRGYISGSGAGGLDVPGVEDDAGMTVEAEVVFPKQASKTSAGHYGVSFTTASLFGLHVPAHIAGAAKTPDDTTDTTWHTNRDGGHDYANFQVYALKENVESNNVRFMLSASNPVTGALASFTALTTSLYPRTYDNTKWNFAVTLRPKKVAPNRSASGGALTSDYSIEFYGVNTEAGVVQNEFILTGSVDDLSGAYFLRSNKKIYAGAHRTNFTGTALSNTDTKISSIRYWTTALSGNVIRAHSRDPANFGTDHPYRSAYLLENNIQGSSWGGTYGQVPEMETLALHWNFEQLTGSDSSGKFTAVDYSSGSSTIASERYNWAGAVAKYQHTAEGYGFPESAVAGVLDRDYIDTQRLQLPENLYSNDTISLLDRNDEISTRDSRPVHLSFAFEKSFYQTISEEILNFFASVLDFNNLVGEPINRYRGEYKDLAKLRQLFFERIGNTPDLDKYLTYYQWVDDTLSKMLEQLIPASANFAKNLRNVVESHILERNIYKTKFPTMEGMSSDREIAVDIGSTSFFDWNNFHQPVQEEIAYGSPYGNISAEDVEWVQPLPGPPTVKSKAAGNAGVEYVFGEFQPPPFDPLQAQPMSTGFVRLVSDIAEFGSSVRITPGQENSSMSKQVQNLRRIKRNKTFSIDRRSGKLEAVGTGAETKPEGKGNRRKSRRTEDGVEYSISYNNELAKGIKHKFYSDMSHGPGVIGLSPNKTMMIAQPDRSAPQRRVRGISRKLSGLHAGTNYAINKNRDYVINSVQPHGPTGLGSGESSTIPANIQISFASDVDTGRQSELWIHPNEKRRLAFGSAASRNFPGLDVHNEGLSYESGKGELIVPFSLYSSSVKTGYNRAVVDGFLSGTEITNLHSDTYANQNEIPMQGPFTERYVGGRQHRHIEINTGSDDISNRPEAWLLLFGTIEQKVGGAMSGQSARSGAIAFVSADYPYPDAPKLANGRYDTSQPSFPLIVHRPRAIYTRPEYAKRPVNIRNIQQATSSGPGTALRTKIGNYTRNYEIVQTSGRSINDPFFRDQSFTFATSSEALGTRGRLPAETPDHKSLLFDGSNDFVNIGLGSAWDPVIGGGDTSGNSAVASVAAFSISMWVYPTTIGDTYPYFFAFGNNRRYLQTWGSGWPDTIRFGIRGYGGVSTTDSATNAIVADTWQHVVVTYEGGHAGDMKIYIDGSQSGTGGSAGSTVYDIPDGELCTIGSYYDGDDNWPGNMCDFAVWSKALSANEIKEVYNNGRRHNLKALGFVKNLHAWWKMGDDSGDTYNGAIHDQMGRFHGTSGASAITVKSPPVIGGTTENLSGNLDYELPQRTGSASNKSIIVERFSAPGGYKINSRGYLDPAHEEFSAYNAYPWRNMSVRGSGSGETGSLRVFDHLGKRRGLRTLLSDHSHKFGADATYGSTLWYDYVAYPSFHKVHRNTRRRLEFNGTASYRDEWQDDTNTVTTGTVYDNWFVQRPIPQSDLQYAWITASAEEATLGYATSSSDITFQSASAVTVGTNFSSRCVTFNSGNTANENVDVRIAGADGTWAHALTGAIFLGTAAKWNNLIAGGTGSFTIGGYYYLTENYYLHRYGGNKGRDNAVLWVLGRNYKLMTNSAHDFSIYYREQGSGSYQAEGSNRFPQSMNFAVGDSKWSQFKEGTGLEAGHWTHFLITVNENRGYGSDPAVQAYYKDSAAVSPTMEGTQNFVAHHGTGITMSDHGQGCFIGNLTGSRRAGSAENDAGGEAEYGELNMSGSVSNFVIFNKALSADEVSELYNDGSPFDYTKHSAADNLVAWWPLGDGYDINNPSNRDSTDGSGAGSWDVHPVSGSPGNIFYDMSGNGHHAVPNGALRSDATVSGSGGGIQEGFHGGNLRQVNFSGSMLVAREKFGKIGRADLNQKDIFNDSVGLNTIIYEPISGSAATLGYPLAHGTPGASLTYYENTSSFERQKIRPLSSLAVSHSGTLNMRSPTWRLGQNNKPIIREEDLLNSVLIHRNGPYQYPSWKQIRTGEHPVARWQRRNNVIGVMETPVVIVNRNNVHTKKLRPGVAHYSESVVVSKFKPLIHVITNGGNSFALKHTYANNLVKFDNIDLNNRLGISDCGSKQSLHELVELSNTGRATVNGILYSETIFPRQISAHKARSRGRLTFDVSYWHNERGGGAGLNWTGSQDRSEINIDKRGQANLRTPSRSRIYHTNSMGYTHLTQSIWPLDARINFNTSSHLWGGIVSKTVAATSWRSGSHDTVGNAGGSTRGSSYAGGIESNPAQGRTGKSYFNELSHSQDGAGELQNNYTFYMSSGSHSASLPGHKKFAVGPVYARRVPSGTLANPDVFVGDALWEAGDQAKKYPFWAKDYAEYAEEMRAFTRGQGHPYAIVPEFRISEHMEFYVVEQGGNFMADTENRNTAPKGAKIQSIQLGGPQGMLTLTGSQLSSSLESEFYKVYSHTDFLEHFGDIGEQHKNTHAPSGIALECKALLKFLPYDGFYPALRTMQLATLLSKSYGHQLVTTASRATAPSAGHPRTFYAPFIAPGILYNTIKSGIAVDYPIATKASGALGEEALETIIFSGSMAEYSVGGDGNEARLLKHSGIGTGMIATVGFDQRLPFEAILAPERYLAAPFICDVEPHPSSTLGRLTPIVKLGYGAGKIVDHRPDKNHVGVGNLAPKPLYSMAMHNFLAESMDFFLKDGRATTFVSRPSSDLVEAIGGTTYSMRLYMSRNKDTVMYDRESAFGPPCGTDAPGIANAGPGTQGITYSPFSPPWFHATGSGAEISAGGLGAQGKVQTWTQIDFSPDESKRYSISEILASSSITVQERVVDIKSQTGFWDQRMKLTASINFFEKAKINATQFEALTGRPATVSDDPSTPIEAWVIQSKYETPVLNFANVDQTMGFDPNENSALTASRGMWHQYGQLCTGSEGIWMQLKDVKHGGASGSLVDLVGFPDEPQRIGQIADEKIIREAVVAIPFIEEGRRRNFFTIKRKNLKIALGEEPLPAGETISKSTKDMLEKMQRYVFPPRLDFLTNRRIPPFAMYIFEFEHTLSKQDLADIWQNLPPDIGKDFEDRGTSDQAAEAVVDHPLFEREFFGETGVPCRLQWMVFKVKQKAKKNYFAKTADTRDDSRFKFNFRLGEGADAASQRDVVPNYSFNWPYDYFSLVELIKIDAEISFEPIENPVRTAGRGPAPESGEPLVDEDGTINEREGRRRRRREGLSTLKEKSPSRTADDE